VATAAAERDAAPEAAKRAANGELVGVPVDLFRGRRFSWIAVAGGCFILSSGSGFFRLEPEAPAATWRVVRHERGVRGVVLARGLDLGYAMGHAEDRAREAGAGRLVQRDAPWRCDPASEKQIATLRRRGLRVPVGLTKGQASDLIAAAVAERRR
jgi:hypothetical protein